MIDGSQGERSPTNLKSRQLSDKLESSSDLISRPRASKSPTREKRAHRNFDMPQAAEYRAIPYPI